MAPRFVITGTGRHGSRYVADVLTASGIRTGHEKWWNSVGAENDGYVGESSWLAAPHLAEFDGVVFHQLRNPLLVVNSLVKFPEPSREDAVRRRTVSLCGDPIEQAIQMVLHWRRICDAASSARWRLEDFSGEIVMMIAKRVWCPVLPTDVVEAITITPRDVNAHTSRPRLEWSDLPAGPETTALRRAAEKDGYYP
jgi:hypothetical protein